MTTPIYQHCVCRNTTITPTQLMTAQITILTITSQTCRIYHTYHTVLSFMNHVIVICNHKGGVGKTALTINLGAALAAQGKKVLLIDLDPQGHLTEGVGVKDLYLKERNTLFEATTDHKGNRDDLIHHIPHEQFDLIASNYQMALIEQKLFMTRNREHKLRELLDDSGTPYDFVLIDCPPNLGNLTDNALNAARNVVVPIQAETSSVRALDLLFDQIESLMANATISIPNTIGITTYFHILNSATRYSNRHLPA